MRISDWSSDVCSSDLQAAELAYSQLQLANSLGMRRIFVDLTPVVRESLRTLAPLFRGAEVVALMREVQPPVPSDAETPEHPLIAATPSLPKTATTLKEKMLTVRERENPHRPGPNRTGGRG